MRSDPLLPPVYLGPGASSLTPAIFLLLNGGNTSHWVVGGAGGKYAYRTLSRGLPPIDEAQLPNQHHHHLLPQCSPSSADFDTCNILPPFKISFLFNLDAFIFKENLSLAINGKSYRSP